MRRLRAMFAALVGVTLVGCPKPAETPTTTTSPTTKKAAKLEPIEAKDFAVLKGRVSYDGAPPADAGRSIKNDRIFAENPDSPMCLLDPSQHSETDLSWVISKGGDVANVAVWLLPGEGRYFRLPDPPNWPKVAFVDQPYCAFQPHVQLHFPGVLDAKGKLDETGQIFEVRNSAALAHNINYQGDPLLGISGNFNLEPKAPPRVIPMPPSSGVVVTIVCDRHKWMKGYIWSLPTPYAAVTDKDGNFEIKGIPAAVELRLVLWHEQPRFFATGGAKGEAVSLKPGDNVRDFKVKAK